jgi:hypothetical protein
MTVLGANSLIEKALLSMWSTSTPHEAHDFLKQPDVIVTNQSDKDIQLDKLLTLNDEVMKVMGSSPTGSQGLPPRPHTNTVLSVTPL